MTTWQLIRSMAQRGYTLEAGPHTGYRGYYAQFRLDNDWAECDECGQRIIPDDWKLAGHGMTLHRAIIMAAKITLGKPVVIPLPEEFK